MGTQREADSRSIGSAEHIESSPGTADMIESIPGTHMIEPTGLHHGHNKANLHGTTLIPRPSANLADPLNWSKNRKLIVVLTQGAYVLFNILPILATAPLYPVLTAEWHKGIQTVTIVTGITTATYGTANFIVVPCASIFGRRPTLLVSSVISLASNIWLALSKSYDSFLGARVLAGIGCAANESIMAIVIADVFFLHERGSWMGFYFYCYVGGVLIGPIIAGAFQQHVNWRMFFWFCAIIQGVAMIALFLFAPETRRSGKFMSDAEITTPSTDSEAVDPGFEKGASQQPAAQESMTTADPNFCRGRPNRSQLLPWQKMDRKAVRELWLHLIMPFIILFYPITFWATMTANLASNTLLFLIMCQSQALAAPPYLWSAQSVGFSNFSPLIGAVVGLAIGGTLSDWVAMKATVRNKGIREPEMRLPTLLPFLAANVIGMIMIGFGFQYGWRWEAPVIVGYSLVGLSSSVIQTIVITYAVDCYKPISGAIMNLATVLKNMFALGMSYYINNWIISSGYLPPMFMMMGLTVGFGLIGVVVFMKWGKTMRTWTRNSKVHQM
ncbi:hypothetical protein VE03_08085 [Pseudogymnoascus sp. 23342-1-I1]|nr:hypothetical protein VE03_08085 [Pseudogymnoascus sp. 23342-1-I1]